MPDFWVDAEPTHDSPYYPFRKTADFDTLAGMEQVPFILCRYLMDLPDATGYVPPDNNKYPRARLKKLLYWDCPLPLEKPLPTPEQTLSLFYDPEKPDVPPDKDRGYRIFPQNMTQQAMSNSGSRIRCYISDSAQLPSKEGFITRQDIIFDVVVNAGIESNTGMTASSRSFDIVQALVEATDGVNFFGIGPMTMRRITKIDDERTFLGYKIYSYIDCHSSAPNPYFV